MKRREHHSSRPSDFLNRRIFARTAGRDRDQRFDAADKFSPVNLLSVSRQREGWSLQPAISMTDGVSIESDVYQQRKPG
jgi:hypothetical protein